VWLNRKTHLSPAMPHFYKKPVMITDGHMQWLYDEKGRRYLDVFGGIVTVSVGHSHPAINKAAQEQLARLQHTTCIYLNDQISMYAKELADRMPGNLKVCYFVNSGSEANDMALLMSRLYTGNSDVMALRNGYHGMSNATMGMTAMHTWKYPVAQGQSVHHAMNPDPYRGAFGNDADAYVRDMRDIINASTSGNMAAFFHESIQGVGGSIEYADGFIPKAYELIREHGGLCIADEVQTGFGHGHQLLGLPEPWRHPRHCDDGQGHRQRLPAGGGGDHARDCADAFAAPALQHVWRQSNRQCGGARGAAHH
jgi:alanine-glyoxylate transaminase/(R)-3-amino-2-methylpropionate-pyruvate transaminase